MSLWLCRSFNQCTVFACPSVFRSVSLLTVCTFLSIISLYFFNLSFPSPYFYVPLCFSIKASLFICLSHSISLAVFLSTCGYLFLLCSPTIHLSIRPLFSKSIPINNTFIYLSVLTPFYLSIYFSLYLFSFSHHFLHLPLSLCISLISPSVSLHLLFTFYLSYLCMFPSVYPSRL